MDQSFDMPSTATHPTVLPEYVVASFAVALVALVFCTRSACARRRHVAAEPVDYAFSASTKIRRRGPTILHFAAKIPPGNDVQPTIAQNFNVQGRDVQSK